MRATARHPGDLMFRIGELARLVGVSVRTLHHYDDLGLLQPATRSESGYRLYDAGQLATLRHILALSRLGLSLDEIRSVTQGEITESLSEVLERKLTELDGERARLDRRAHLIRLELAKERRMTDYTVQLKTLPAQRMLTVSEAASDYRHVTAPMNAAYDVACRAHADLGLLDVGWSVVTWGGGGYASEDAIDLQVALPVFGDASVDAPPGVTLLTHPAMLVVSTVHVGSYERFGEAYAALLAWLERHRFEVAGPVREVYLRHGVRDDEHLSEVQVPVQPADLGRAAAVGC